MLTVRDAKRVLGLWRDIHSAVSCADIDIVFNICAQGELSVKQLILTSASSRTTVLRRLTILVRRGMAVARPDPDDKRARLLTLTAKGQMWAERVACLLERRPGPPGNKEGSYESSGYAADAGGP